MKAFNLKGWEMNLLSLVFLVSEIVEPYGQTVSSLSSGGLTPGEECHKPLWSCVSSRPEPGQTWRRPRRSDAEAAATVRRGGGHDGAVGPLHSKLTIICCLFSEHLVLCVLCDARAHYY